MLRGRCQFATRHLVLGHHLVVLRCQAAIQLRFELRAQHEVQRGFVDALVVCSAWALPLSVVEKRKDATADALVAVRLQLPGFFNQVERRSLRLPHIGFPLRGRWIFACSLGQGAWRVGLEQRIFFRRWHYLGSLVKRFGRYRVFSLQRR